MPAREPSIMAQEAVSKDTRITIGFAILVAASIVGAWTSISSHLNQLSNEIRDLKYAQQTIESKMSTQMSSMSTQMSNRWTHTDMMLWIERMRRLNPSMGFPDSPGGG